ncbi:glycerol uptake operon antiterminator [Desulfohalotomaculum tongense]|uniref:glycerol-3-phosphate responsive antiterminator n=1 Tax=Desulforadius tongensis TaxID=1216062 RepID=UPI00195CE40B|nr:glycerol-3-phosphate responsive antiterminator [Desulforadius tongensis]MBM7855990.1 glycerol uptake operon antiterminator [Desulforadius tongensis]
MEFLEKLMQRKKIGAAIRRVTDLEEALQHPSISTVFLLGGDINFLPAMVKRARAANKNFLVHVDLVEGVGKDRAGIHLLARFGISGIVTTKSSLVKYAKDEGLWTVQRLFIVDSEAIKTGIKVVESIRPSAIEILPATVPQYVIEDIKRRVALPVLGGGLLKTEADVAEAFAKGIDAISTSRRALWNIKCF